MCSWGRCIHGLGETLTLVVEEHGLVPVFTQHGIDDECHLVGFDERYPVGDGIIEVSYEHVSRSSHAHRRPCCHQHEQHHSFDLFHHIFAYLFRKGIVGDETPGILLVIFGG